MEDAESHRIPQDVTGFQFKIIGDMTVKQFAYLAGPTFLAWIFFQLPISLFIKLPLSLLSAGLGASLAFLPIEGRPMDAMIANFIKALFNPTLFVYQKKGGGLWFPEFQKEKVQEASVSGTLSTLRVSTKPQDTKFDEEETTDLLPTYPTPLSPISPQDLFSPKSQTIKTTVQGLSPTPRIISMQGVFEKSTPLALEKKIQEETDEALEKKVVTLEKDLEMAREDMAALQQKLVIPTFSPPKETLGLENQLQTLLVQKEQLTKQLVTLQQKLDLQKKNVFTPTIAKATSDVAKAQVQTQNVRQIPKGVGKSVGLPIVPQSPNIITGIIEDPRGNPIANILVEVKDNEGNPVRAFKTNGVGQFASATPLKNGVYTISFEDPKGQNKFDAIEFSVKGEVILPIEVLSIDTREELRKSLFRES